MWGQLTSVIPTAPPWRSQKAQVKETILLGQAKDRGLKKNSATRCLSEAKVRCRVPCFTAEVEMADLPSGDMHVLENNHS